MSDHIEVDGKKYYNESYIQLANSVAERRGARIAELEGLLSGDPDNTAGPVNREAWRWSAIKYADKVLLEKQELERQLKIATAKQALYHGMAKGLLNRMRRVPCDYGGNHSLADCACDPHGLGEADTKSD